MVHRAVVCPRNRTLSPRFGPSSLRSFPPLLPLQMDNGQIEVFNA